jgi:hypothetical protein
VITVCYTLGIYLLNLFLAFLTPKFDPSLEQDDEMEGGGQSALPTKQDEEFRPFIRRLPEFKFWHNATRAIAIGIVATLFDACDIPGTFDPNSVLQDGVTCDTQTPRRTKRRLCGSLELMVTF